MKTVCIYMEKEGDVMYFEGCKSIKQRKKFCPTKRHIILMSIRIYAFSSQGSALSSRCDLKKRGNNTS